VSNARGTEFVCSWYCLGCGYEKYDNTSRGLQNGKCPKCGKPLWVRFEIKNKEEIKSGRD